MLQQNTINFLAALAENNNKPWFDDNRDVYAAAKEDHVLLVDELLKALAPLEPALAEQKAKDCIFRIFRDVRFGKDKTPYKANFGAVFSKGGRKHMGAGYYLHLEPGGKSFAGGGIWMPDAPVLKAIRQEIDYNFAEFSGIVNDKKFKKLFPKIEGEALKKVPQGYADDNPAMEYLKLKSFTVGHPIPDADLTSKKLVKSITDIFTTMSPFINFMNRVVE